MVAAVSRIHQCKNGGTPHAGLQPPCLGRAQRARNSFCLRRAPRNTFRPLSCGPSGAAGRADEPTPTLTPRPRLRARPHRDRRFIGEEATSKQEFLCSVQTSVPPLPLPLPLLLPLTPLLTSRRRHEARRAAGLRVAVVVVVVAGGVQRVGASTAAPMRQHPRRRRGARWVVGLRVGGVQRAGAFTAAPTRQHPRRRHGARRAVGL